MTISDENLSQESDWSNSRTVYSQDGSAKMYWQRNASYYPRKRKPARLKDYGTASGGRARASQAEDMSLFEESSDSDLFSHHSEEQEGSVEKHMDQVMMLEGTGTEIQGEITISDSPKPAGQETQPGSGRCRFCKISGTAGQACERCPRLYSDKPFIYEQSLYDDILKDPPKERIVRRQNIIVDHVSNRGNGRNRYDEPVKLELLQVEPPRGRQELPEDCFNEVEGEVTLTYLPGYAEDIAELMMPVNNGYYLKAPLEGLQVFRKNSDGGFTEVPYEVGCLSYDVEGRHAGRCQLCKRTGPAGLQCVSCPQTLRNSASKASFLHLYKTGLMNSIPHYYRKGVHESLEVFVGAQDKSPENHDVSMVSTLSENLALRDPEERANVPTLGEVILDYNRNESYLRMNMYQGVYAEIPFSHETFRTVQGDYGPLDPYIGCVRLDGPSRFGINSWLLDSGASVHIVKNHKHCTALHLSEDPVKLGNTTKVPYSEQGTVHLRDRKTGLTMKIQDAKVIPGFAYNMVSLGKLLQQGYTILGKLLWAEATKCASLRTSLTINTATNEPPDKMWYGAAHWENRSKQIVSKMNPFGRIGYVKTKKKIAGKLVEKTTKCIHLSNAEDHPHDTYRMYNPMTRAVILTRNVTWAAWAPSASQDSLEHIFEQNPDDIADLEDGIEDIAWADRRPAPHAIPDGDTGDDLPMGRIKNPDVEMIPAHLAGRRNGDGNGNRTINDGDSEDDEAGRIQVEEDNFPEQTNADEAMTEEDQDPPMTTPTPPNAISAKSRKVASAMRKLQGYYNPLVTETLDKANDPTVIEPEDDVMDEDEVAGVEFSATLTSDPGEPQTFREAVDGPAREKWLPSTKAEVLGSISREAERVAGTECANEAMFQSMLLEELLGRKVQATILNDNTRAIFMVKNHTVGSRTKPIRVWHLYMRELRERGRVKVEFIPTAQNVSNIGTKNLGEKRFNKHTNRMLDSRILECLREDVKMYDVSEDKSSERARSPSPMSRNRMSQPIETDSCPSRLTRLSRVV
jgi:hypothetical protein